MGCGHRAGSGVLAMQVSPAKLDPQPLPAHRTAVSCMWEHHATFPLLQGRGVLPQICSQHTSLVLG